MSAPGGASPPLAATTRTSTPSPSRTAGWSSASTCGCTPGRVRLAPVFDARSVDSLRAAYGAAYGLSLKREWLLRSHRAVAPLAWALSRLERLHAHAAPGRARPLRRRALCALARALARRLSERNRAFLLPLPAPRPLVTAYDETAASFWTTMRRFQLDGLRGLGEPDLDGKLVPARLSA